MYKKNTIIQIYYDIEKHQMYSLDDTTLKMYSRQLVWSLKLSYLFPVMIGGAVLFNLAILPQIGEWFETQGLNALSGEIKNILVLMGYLMGLIVFGLGQKTPLKNPLLTKEEYFEKYNHTKEIKPLDEIISKGSKKLRVSSLSIIACFTFGVIAFVRFLSYSYFLTYTHGVVFTILAGMLAINFKDAIRTALVIKKYRANPPADDVDDKIGKKINGASTKGLKEFEEAGIVRVVDSIDWSELKKRE